MTFAILLHMSRYKKAWQLSHQHLLYSSNDETDTQNVLRYGGFQLGFNSVN